MYDRQQQIVSPYNFLRPVSVGAPLMFTQPGNDGTTAPVPITGAVTTQGTVMISSIAPIGTGSASSQVAEAFSSLEMQNLYLKPDGSSATWGPTTPTDGYTEPLLHLYFFLKPPTLAPPNKRFPQFGEIVNVRVPAAPGTEQLVAQFPVFGRKTVTLIITALSTALTAIRIGAIYDVSSAGSAPQDVTVATSGALAAGRAVRIVIDPLYASYLFVNATTADAGGVEAESFILAVDD